MDLRIHMMMSKDGIVYEMYREIEPGVRYLIKNKFAMISFGEGDFLEAKNYYDSFPDKTELRLFKETIETITFDGETK